VIAGLVAIPSGATSTSPSAPSVSIPGAVLQLVVSPVSATVVAGGTVPFEAGVLPDGCLNVETQFDWEPLGGASSLGSLNSTGGSSNEFHAFPYSNGTVKILLLAVALLLCGVTLTNGTGSALLSVQVVRPLFLGALLPSADPIGPGSSVTLSTTVSGGLPPYRATFDFGDGSTGTGEADVAGELSVSHVYSAGRYSPTVSVTDALGELATGPGSEAIVASAHIAVAIIDPGPRVDEGFPTHLLAEVANAIGNFTLRWSDSFGDRSVGSSWVVNFSEPGPVTVLVSVSDDLGDIGNASVELTVEPPLGLAVRSGVAEVDLGEKVPVELLLSGGVAPFYVIANALGSESEFHASGVVARSVNGTLLPFAPGPFVVEVGAVDAVGARAGVEELVATVEDAPRLLVNLTPGGEVEVGEAFTVMGVLSAGSAPFNWSIDSTLPLSSSSAPSGALSTDGLLAWTGSVATPGFGALELTVRDGTGAPVSWNESLTVLASLHASLLGNGEATTGHPWPIEAWVEGGAPPYTVEFQSTDGESHLANLTAAGSVSWVAQPSEPGLWQASATVVDRLGAEIRVTFNGSVSAAPGGTPGSGNPPSTNSDAPSSSTPGVDEGFLGGLGTAVGLALIGLVAWVFLRGRFRPAASKPPAVSSTALAVVRRLLRENDGVDRDTLDLLAEEEGVDPATVGPAVSRWESLGRVRREASGEGSETLYWEAAGRPGSRPAGLPPDPEGTNP